MTWLSRGVVALGVCALPQLAFAQDAPVVDSAAEARQQYQQGTTAFQAKHYEEAALHFEAAASYRTNAVALYTAALAWDNAAKPERAADAYSRAIAVGGLEAKQSTLAKDRVAQLEKMLGTAAVSAPDGWKVQLDTFTEVPAAAPGARLHGSAGVHSLSIRAPGKPIERRDLTLEGGKVTTLELKDEPKPVVKVEPPKPAPVVVAPPPPPRLQESYWIPRRVAGVGVAGVGFASLVGGIILGLQANGAKDAYDAGPTRESFDHASSLQTWTNVTLIAGGVLLAGGVALVVVPDKDRGDGRVQVGVSPAGAMMTGSF